MKKTSTPLWQPTGSLHNLKLRAQILQTLRTFFAERQVLEVDTPLLSQATVTDVYLQSMEVQISNMHEITPATPYATLQIGTCEGTQVGGVIPYTFLSNDAKTYYLQTSPEFAMKRLLAAGSGAIYQICKAFRQDELGRLHNPEFTMLEWYRPGFNHQQLMDEIAVLLNVCLGTLTTERSSYAEIFQRYLDIDPHTASPSQLKKCALTLGMHEVPGIDVEDKDIWLQRLLSDYIEPKLGFDAPIFIYDFPASQAALAKVRPGVPPLAERFELYIKGIEIANGYHELTDASEQARRFETDLAKRHTLGLSIINSDQRLLAALKHGLPACAGVALGVDRLIMLAAHAESLEQVVSFTIDRA
ncbi:elongation factor P--(R)-beta-lysine ligase [soil metagenome]